MKSSFIFLLTLLSCFQNAKNEKITLPETKRETPKNKDTIKVIHVFVALCDNKYQGIVPVPAKIGNGQDAASNLYWGCGYGVKSFFKNSNKWSLLSSKKNYKNFVLERCVFKYKSNNIYLIADAYDGKFIKNCTIDFFKASCGNLTDSIVNTDTIYGGGSAQLICYVGHDGLMDFELNEIFKKQNDNKRETIMLACYSKNYFKPHLVNTGAYPIIWSTGLMSPEAYTLEAAIDAWIHKEDNSTIRKKAAAAYHQYQKCGMKGAMNLLVTGW